MKKCLYSILSFSPCHLKINVTETQGHALQTYRPTRVWDHLGHTFQVSLNEQALCK